VAAPVPRPSQQVDASTRLSTALSGSLAMIANAASAQALGHAAVADMRHQCVVSTASQTMQRHNTHKTCDIHCKIHSKYHYSNMSAHELDMQHRHTVIHSDLRHQTK